MTLLHLGSYFRSLQVNMLRESEGDTAFDDGDVVVFSQEKVPWRTSSPRPVSTALSGVTLSSSYVPQGEGTFSKDVVWHANILTFAAWIKSARLTDGSPGRFYISGFSSVKLRFLVVRFEFGWCSVHHSDDADATFQELFIGRSRRYIR